MLTSRSATLVVATEQLCGNFGRPQTEPSFKCRRIRRNEPALRGTDESIELNTPAIADADAHASLSLKPHSTLSMLSVRSTSIYAAVGSILISTLSGMPSGSKSPNGSCFPVLRSVTLGCLQLA